MAPVLPSVAETEKIIEIYRKEGQKESNSREKTNNAMFMEEEDPYQDLDEEEITTSDEEIEEDENNQTDEEDSNGKQVEWNLDNLSQEAKEKENRRMETDVAFDIAPVIDIHIPHNESNTTLATQLQEPKKKKKAEIAIREPRRSSRPRAGIPAKYRD